VSWNSSVAAALENSMGSALTLIQTVDDRVLVGSVNVKVTNVTSNIVNLTSFQRDITISAVAT
jgi:hypothetical protein